MPVASYLIVGALLAAIGAYGLLTARNGIKVLMCIELLLSAGILNLVAFAGYHDEPSGYVLAMFAIALAAGEAAIGLSILIALFKLKRHVDVSLLRLLKG
jgi:NADH-quinone oxidoreductase subunit K